MRSNLVAAQKRAWARLAETGEWWSGAVRVAIAEETRAATECADRRERKAALSPYAVSGTHSAALSPYAVSGTHSAATDLPDVLVEVTRRIRTDPGRLPRRFFADALAGGLGDAEYVETVGVMATVIAIDSFCDAMGPPRRELPVPVAGEPHRCRPARRKGSHGCRP